MNDTNDTNDDTTMNDSNDDTGEKVHDLTDRRPPTNNTETTTVKLTQVQIYTIVNSLGADAIVQRDKGRMNNYENRWELRQALRDAAGISGDDQ
jgi:hypothetical protein